MALKVYNTLSRTREAFVPLDPPRVGMYVCGPTVYGHSHLGHAKSYVSFDAILRWLRTPAPLGPGYVVNYVQNITDVGHLTDDADEGEDKIVAEARRRGLHPMAVVETFMRSYFEDMDALNVLRPDISPRASGHIPEQIEQVKALLARGHAYESNGSVYFDVTSFPDYGKLSGRRFEQMEAGARVEVNPEKRHPADFALWKRAEPGHIMRWPSPWGEGFPGWHLECSVMSAKYLGPTFDIHGGGIENQFPHHECEIAQHECATGRPFARYWLHNNMCTLEGQKMGKALGNSILLKDVFQGREGGVRDRAGNVLLDRTFEPVVVRHFILTSHYRQTLDFSSDALKAAESGSYRLRDALRALEAAAARWRGATQPGGHEATEPRSHEATEPRSDGATKPRSYGATKPRSHEATEPRSDGAAGGADPSRDREGAVAKVDSRARTGLPVSTDFAAGAASEPVRSALADIQTRFAEAMNDDFNTAAAIATLFDLARQSAAWVNDAPAFAGHASRASALAGEASRASALAGEASRASALAGEASRASALAGEAARASVVAGDLAAAAGLFRFLAGDVLGLKWADERPSRATSNEGELMRILIELRDEARRSRNFAIADQVRQRLSAAGYELRDGPEGTTWVRRT